MFPNFLSPMGFSYPGWAKHPRHPAPLLPVSLDQNIGFTWLQAAAGELRASCFFQARGSGLMIIKTKLWDSDKIFWADCRGFNTNSVQSPLSAQISWRGHSPGEAQGSLPGFQFHTFHSKITFPCFSPLFHLPYQLHFFLCCAVIVIQGKKNPPRIFM